MFKLIRLIEKGFVVFSLLIFTGALLPVVNQVRGMQPNESDPIRQVIFFGIWTGNILLIIAWRKKVINIITKEKLLWFVVGIAIVSLFWSAAPEETLRNVIALVMSTLFGVYLAARYSMNEQLRLLAWALGIGALLSLVVALTLPRYGVMGTGDILTSQEIAHLGTWKGVYGHKNFFGLFMSLGALVFSLLIKSNNKNCWITWVFLCLCVSLLLFSTSKTALIVFLAIIALSPLYRALRWNYTFAVPLFIAVILVGGSVATLFFNNAEAILAAFGRNTTLSGRTLLWATVFYKILQRPWLGYGYGGFWLGWEGESADVWRIVRWEVPHAHNGFLDLWLNLGLLGLLAFAFSYIAVCLNALRWLRQTKTAEGLWPLAYLTFLLLVNLSESALLRLNCMWILYVAITLSMQNMSENLAASKAEWHYEVNGKAMKQMKQIKQGIRGGRA